MCGIFGISGHPEAARLAYFGLYALQHRGQESAGIATYDGTSIHLHAGMGLVPDVFTEQTLSNELRGDIAIGHVRYATTGSSALRNAQPLVARVRGMEIAIGHNGNLTNAAQLRKELEDEGAIFQTTTDTEIFVHLIARNMQNGNLEQAVLDACARVQGAYALILLSGKKIIALRDAHGFRPLSIGILHGDSSQDQAFVFASETCAFDLLEAEYIRDVNPGEMVILEDGKMTSVKIPGSETVPVRQCIFELIYFARPDSIVFGEDVYRCRKNMGMQISREMKTDADLVMPFPDSGVYSALGFSQHSGIPYEHAYIRNHYVGRTFIQPSQNMRNYGVRVKLNPVRSMIMGKRLCIVDDSIVRGTTVRTRVEKLRELGATEVHCRVSCPPLLNPCFYGIALSTHKELIAANHPLESLPDLLKLDSLHYLTIEGLLKTVSHPDNYCLACFNGDYPVPCNGCDASSCSRKSA
ncbi:MAG: amidophosphoribosyltransferase [Desulfovibrionaceae bacterium]|nr:amidophosphoribosyltransferase [Desulfovibrionaceae bacterium]